MTLEAIRYSRGKLEILDQLLLPLELKYIHVKDVEDGWNVIKKMQVRGAPAIGIVGSLSLAEELIQKQFDSTDALELWIVDKLKYLVTARPTAVNMADAERKINKAVAELKASAVSVADIKERVVVMCEQMKVADIGYNKAMGKYASEDILRKTRNEEATVLTHCNTGSLATAGYGTALGVVRALHERGKLRHCYCTETRPYNQGCRLTAFELVYEKMPATLICDSMAAALMKEQKISAVLIGADVIVANGDTANKIGSYQLALIAQYHNVPFYVVAPSTSIDMNRETGEEIVIEERPQDEMTFVTGKRLAAPGIHCWNPAFDVTPHELITGGIVTEHGLFKPCELKQALSRLL